MYGMLSTEFFLSPSWSILYTSFGDIANLLSLPIWIVSFTLLYFDSRVRKEAYDVDLLAREINPGFYWQPALRTSAFGYQMPAQASTGRSYVQTSPLGLAGYIPPRPRPAPPAPESSGPPPTESEELLDKFERAAENLREKDQTSDQESATEVPSATCKTCGAQLVEGARFCINCGAVTV